MAPHGWDSNIAAQGISGKLGVTAPAASAPRGSTAAVARAVTALRNMRVQVITVVKRGVKPSKDMAGVNQLQAPASKPPARYDFALRP